MSGLGGQRCAGGIRLRLRLRRVQAGSGSAFGFAVTGSPHHNEGAKRWNV